MLYFAGILPVVIWRDRLWCLLATETYDGSLASFGGGPEHYESPVDTAVRESWEESGGAILRKNLRQAINSTRLAFWSPNNESVQFVVPVKDPMLVERIQSALDLCAKCSISNMRGCCEKRQCEWILLSDIWQSPCLRARLRRPFRKFMESLGSFSQVDHDIRVALASSTSRGI